MRKRLRVVAAGTFDGIHDGHRYYLRVAKSLGDDLTVIVARDATVPLVKGKRALRNERQRRADVAKLPEVNRALLGRRLRTNDQDERFRVLLRLRPDVICLGYDQPVKARKLRRFLDTHGMTRTRIARARALPKKE